MEITRLSSKGQLILPKAIRDIHHWVSGLEFTVENKDDGVFLRPLRSSKPTRVKDLLGCTGYRGQAKTIEEMDAAIASGVKESRKR